jgi:hypothetical protein
MRTCRQCRERTQWSMKKERQVQTKQWKEQNAEYIRLYNKFYRNYPHLHKAEWELMFQEIRRTPQIPDRVWDGHYNNGDTVIPLFLDLGIVVIFLSV